MLLGNGTGKRSTSLKYMYQKYCLLGKSEWWFIMDDVILEVSRQLQRSHFAIIDNFLSVDEVAQMQQEVRNCQDNGYLAPGVLAGGKTGQALSYVMQEVFLT
jgi:hypothetical protein